MQSISCDDGYESLPTNAFGAMDFGDCEEDYPEDASSSSKWQ